MKRWTSSAALRLFVNVSVRRPRSTKPACSFAASASAEPRSPSSSSRSGGFQRTTVRSARGAASSPMTVTGAPSRSAQTAGVRDGSGGEQELRLRAVDARQAAETPQHVGDVRAEDAPVDVRLVDDDVAEVREHVAPALVVRQQADVDHVRVGEDRVRPLADLPALLARRVAVVDRRAQLRHAQAASVRNWSCASAFVG